MEAAVTAFLKFIYEVWGPGLLVAMVGIVLTVWGSVWVILRAKVVLDGVTISNNRLAAAQEQSNQNYTEQQRLCRNHTESQRTVVDAVSSLVIEVHNATTSGNRIQENNIREILGLLERETQGNRETMKELFGQMRDLLTKDKEKPHGLDGSA